ncbi:MAG: SCO family protein [Anaerolineae bacterium]
MRKIAIIHLIIALMIFLGFTACGGASPSFRGTELSPPPPAIDFTLTDQYGHAFRLSDQRGQVVLLFFGYTHCPDVCPTTLARWKQVSDALGDDAKRVRFVFVTVDPERDTPERLQQHLDIFNPDFVGLTGSPDEMEPIYRAYSIYHEKVAASDSALDYLVNHSGSVFLVDPQGRWRVSYSFGTPPDDIVHDIRELLRG